MKNRLSLLLVAGALAIPAMAADAPKTEWNIYGTLVTEINNMKVTGQPTEVASRNRFTCATSNLGIKGSVQATSDLKVIWQIESSVGVDGDAPSTWAGRNTALGLETKFGTILAGQWDTPYKDVQMKVNAFPTALQSDINIINNAGFNTPGTVTTSSAKTSSGAAYAIAASNAAFNRRQGNSLQYWSPVIEGFQAKVMYSINESKSTTAANLDNPTLLSASFTYKNGPLTASYAFEQHTDYYGANGLALSSITGSTHSNDTGHELAVYYVLPTKTRLCAIVEQLKYHTDGNATYTDTDYKRTAWYLTATQDIDAHKVWAGFGVAGKGTLEYDGLKATSDVDFGAKQYSVGYAYTFAKGVSVFADAFGVINDKNAQYGLMPQIAAVSAGGDTRGFGIGAFYKF